MNLVKIFLFTFLFQGCLYAQISDSYLDEAEEKIKIELLVLIEETYNALETKPSEGVPQKGDRSPVSPLLNGFAPNLV